MRERISNKMMEKENFNVVDIFGENVFNDSVMQARLPKKVYKKLHEVMEEGKELDLETADVVAHEMKEWAIEKGATHYTHWFQPLTGVTAEKHDSFITVLPRHLSDRTQQAQHSAFRLHSVPTQEKRLTRRHHCFVPWKRSTSRHCV